MMAHFVMPLLVFVFFMSCPIQCTPEISTLKSTGHGSRPNIVVILVDDLGIGDIGPYGNTTLATPNIDSLARDGAKLTQFLAAASVCTPSRAALLTGRYPVRSGLAGLKNDIVILATGSQAGLPLEEVTIPELLKDAGYKTGLIGKWHLGLNKYWPGDNVHNPLNHGFDYWFGIPLTLLRDFDPEEMRRRPIILQVVPLYPIYVYSSILIGVLTAALLWQKGIIGAWLCLLMALVCTLVPYYFIWFAYHLTFINSMLYRNYELIEQPIDFDGMTKRLVEEGIGFLESRHADNQPFFLEMSLLQLHTNLHAGPDFRGTSAHGLYGDEVQEMDWSVGQILGALDRLGMRDNTLVLFTSDHGGHVEERGWRGDRQGGHNGIYRGGKFQGGMDGGIRVPGLIRWPGHVIPGSEIHVPLSNMDLLPTVAEATGVALPAGRVIDGVSMLPLLTGETTEAPERDYLIHYCSEYIHAVRFKPDQDGAVWKVRYASPNWLPGTEGCVFWCLCTKAIYHDIPLVFDMTSDPRESHPLADSDPRARRIVTAAENAIRKHTGSIEVVESQTTRLKLLFRPYLQSCCNFPYCMCKDQKQYKYKAESGV